MQFLLCKTLRYGFESYDFKFNLYCIANRRFNSPTALSVVKLVGQVEAIQFVV